jgi:hypothetical protein
LSRLRKREVEAVKVVETYTSQDGDEVAKHNTYLKALGTLDAVIEENPEYASAWNNRAQLRRWRYGDRGVLTRKSEEVVSTQAMEARRTISLALHDLATALSLASPAPNAPVSSTQGKILASAWTQRAAIFWGAAKDLSSSTTKLIPPEDGEVALEWAGWDKTRFEEEGSRCFYMAGVYGSEVGRAMAVLSNPTAKLCGKIVGEAMRRERGE